MDYLLKHLLKYGGFNKSEDLCQFNGKILCVGVKLPDGTGRFSDYEVVDIVNVDVDEEQPLFMTLTLGVNGYSQSANCTIKFLYGRPRNAWDLKLDELVPGM